ncbi:MAG: hypothetical protein AAF512_13530 [Pseudomonadota bacterium]
MEDEAGATQLQQAGLRGLPIVAQDDTYIYGTNLAQVAELVGLENYDATPVLSAPALVARYQKVLDAALRFGRQIPVEHLDDILPHRDRSYLTLINHLVQIAHDFLAITQGESLTGRRAMSLPKENYTIDALSARVTEANTGLSHWCQTANDDEMRRTVDTYFGDQTLHQVLERAVWYSAQHVRQLMMILDILSITADTPLESADLSDLPMPENVWDG